MHAGKLSLKPFIPEFLVFISFHEMKMAPA
jgi:hypothetical protein